MIQHSQSKILKILKGCNSELCFQDFRTDWFLIYLAKANVVEIPIEAKTREM